jgi:hypothetical protein
MRVFLSHDSSFKKKLFYCVEVFGRTQGIHGETQNAENLYKKHHSDVEIRLKFQQILSRGMKPLKGFTAPTILAKHFEIMDCTL